VFLIPSDGRPDDESTWLPLDEVLSRVRRANTPRMLILDVRPTSDPRAVVAAEDVNNLLDATLAKLSETGELPFFVLTANTPPEGANVLRAVKHSAFGLALAHGAGGAADGWNSDRKRDGRVSARRTCDRTPVNSRTTLRLPPAFRRKCRVCTVMEATSICSPFRATGRCRCRLWPIRAISRIAPGRVERSRKLVRRRAPATRSARHAAFHARRDASRAPLACRR